MRIVKGPGKLNCIVENLLQRLCGTALVEFFTSNRLRKILSLHILSKHTGNLSKRANVVATDDMGMESELDPVFRLAFESSFASGLCKNLSTRTLHRKIQIPFPVVNSVDNSHASLPNHVDYFVCIEDDFADMPFGR